MGLYPFQQQGAEWLASRKRAYLADVMGLGKTPQAIVGATLAGYTRIAVVAPASMVGTWEIEVLKWSDWNRTFRVYSYDTLVRNKIVRQGLISFDPELVIADEGHYLKGRNTKRTNLVLKTLAKNRPTWLLSGTPMPNGPHELYTAFKYLQPQTLQQAGIKNYIDWLNTFCQWSPGDYGPRIWGPKNTPLLRQWLFDSGFMLRRTFSDVELQLPKLDLRTLPLVGKPSPELDMMLDLMGMDWNLSYGDLPEQSEHISTTRRLLGEHKAKLVAPILFEELANETSHRKVVFGYHTSVLDTLESALQSFGVLRLDGSTPKAVRTEMISIFQNEESHRVFLSQITAGGVGITLTASSDAMIVEPSWVPGENAQAIARVLRIGQVADTVTARMAVLHGTLDDPLTGIIRRKEIMNAQTLDG